MANVRKRKMDVVDHEGIKVMPLPPLSAKEMEKRLLDPNTPEGKALFNYLVNAAIFELDMDNLLRIMAEQMQTKEEQERAKLMATQAYQAAKEQDFHYAQAQIRQSLAPVITAEKDNSFLQKLIDQKAKLMISLAANQAQLKSLQAQLAASQQTQVGLQNKVKAIQKTQVQRALAKLGPIYNGMNLTDPHDQAAQAWKQRVEEMLAASPEGREINIIRRSYVNGGPSLETMARFKLTMNFLKYIRENYIEDVDFLKEGTIKQLLLVIRNEKGLLDAVGDEYADVEELTKKVEILTELEKEAMTNTELEALIEEKEKTIAMQEAAMEKLKVEIRDYLKSDEEVEQNKRPRLASGSSK